MVGWNGNVASFSIFDDLIVTVCAFTLKHVINQNILSFIYITAITYLSCLCTAYDKQVLYLIHVYVTLWTKIWTTLFNVLKI